MKLKNRWLIATMLLAIMMVLVLVACAQSTNRLDSISVETQTSDFYVNDFAEIFSESQKASLMENAVTFDDQTGGIQVVVTTVTSLNGYTIEDYAHKMYNQYGIGRNNMGALILFSTGDRKVRIEVGNNMEEYLTDSISGRLIDNNSIEDFRADRFDVGLIALQDALIEHIASTVPENWNQNLSDAPTENEDISDKSIPTSTKNDQYVPVNEEKTVSNKTNIPYVSLLAVFLLMLISLFGAIRESFSSRKYQILSQEQEKEIKSLKANHKDYVDTLRKNFEEKIAHMRQESENALQLTQNRCNRVVQEMDSKNQSLVAELLSRSHEINNLSIALSALENKFKRVCLLHPDIEDEIALQIQQERRHEAEEIDKKLQEVMKYKVDKANVDIFKEACRVIHSISPDVMQYLQTDVTAIDELYHASDKLLQAYLKEEQEKADRSIASKVEEHMKQLMNIYAEGSYSNYSEFSAVGQQYEALTSVQKAFVNQDVFRSFTQHFFAAQNDQNLYNAAKEAERRVSSVIGQMHSAHEDDRDKLKRAMRYYRDLSSDEVKYFSPSLYESLKKFVKQADDDHTEQQRKRRIRREEEERRMRQASVYYSHHSSSGFGGHSGFSGHGGMSSGGGASRGF